MGLLKIKAMGIEITACESFIDVTCLFYIVLVIEETWGFKFSKMNRIQSNLQKKILIIEDDNIIIKIIEHFLENEDYSVSVAQDGEVGLKKIIEDKPDLILLDIMVPSMSGLQLLEKLKEDTQLSQIPIIIISSLSQDEDILKGLEKGAMDYVPKPFSPQILIAKVKKYLD